MKISKSKQELASIISDSGGWCDGCDFVAQDKDSFVCFYDGKPTRCGDSWEDKGDCQYRYGRNQDGKIQNWHQTILSRSEYFHLYPAQDADGWVEWKGGECPVNGDSIIDLKLSDGDEFFGFDADWDWQNGSGCDIVAYRLHKPEQAEPEFCESVMRSIPEPSDKPTIEQLAADYRNANDYAERKQQEADDAKAAADAALGELERACEALGLLIGIAKSDQELELVITDWRDLLVNDVIFVGEYDERESGEYVVIELEDRDYGGCYAVKAAGIDGNGRWIDTAMEWRFIRRP